MSAVFRSPRLTRSHDVDLSRVGHELRAPLNTVLGMAEILADGFLSAEQRAQVEMLQRAGRRLLVLVNALLDGSPTPKAPTDATGDADRLTGVRVLVVDDSVESRTLVEAYLARTGVHLTLVDRGEAALDAIAGQRFDVVLLDMRLPDKSGLEVVRAIRQAERVCGAEPLRVVGLSADVHPSAVSAAMSAGCSAYLAKPIDRCALLGALLVSRMPTPALKASFLLHRAAEITAARAALRRRDFEHLATVGHNLQGSGKSYGFPAMSALGQRIEASAKASDARAVALLLTELASAVCDASSGGAAFGRKSASQTRMKAAGDGVRGRPKGQ
jgi:CheY-like chemotaxis protein